MALTSEPVVEIAPSDAHELARTGGATLVDIREPWEWETGSAADARRIAMGALRTQLSALPTDRPVLLICASGNRSRVAAEYLAAQGFDARSVTGGTAAWGLRGLPIS